jgi:hypothetical protein
MRQMDTKKAGVMVGGITPAGGVEKPFLNDRTGLKYI